ncbi:D-alanine--D-alanine ligase [candidate division KSB1 bacterium]|nr:D-alanine--D-alanine ligase [candidate division KSB1 bacterium]
MKVTVLYSEVAEHSSLDDLDVLMQVEAVSQALQKLGHKPIPLPISLDLSAALERLNEQRPDFVFNLVEGLQGVGRFIHFAPALLDQLKVPYSGGSTHALYVTTNKILSKNLLRAADLPTPVWSSSTDALQTKPPFPPPYIVKPAWEDASVGIDEESLVYEREQLAEILGKKTTRHGECLVEAYIDGREFNLGILAGLDGPMALPAAEMLFSDFPPDKPRIVDYRAKWHEDSFEYQNTTRTFDWPASDAALIQRMQDIALRCWQLFGLRGYARVDFRVDGHGHPWILEVNVNPCISPDGGFVAASQRVGLKYEEMIDRIIHDSMR